MNAVFVVLHDNYGDQGVDFKGTFATWADAHEFVVRNEPDLRERQYWLIQESPVQGSEPAR